MNITNILSAALGLKRILFVGFVYGGSTALAQNKNAGLQAQSFPQNIDSDCVFDYAAVRNLHQNKEIPERVEKQVLLALSRYPELAQTPIRFAYRNIKTTMASRPCFSFLFSNKQNREYLISINPRIHKDNGVHFDNLSFNAQVGIIGHELAHVLYYKNKSTAAIVHDGIGYTFAAFRKRFEADTDKLAIQRGFGWQIYDFTRYVLMQSGASEAYKDYKRKFYLSPNELKTYIVKTNGYGKSKNELWPSGARN